MPQPADVKPPRFLDIREYTDAPFDCPTHGQVFQVLQFNDDPARCYCAACFEAMLVASPTVELAERRD